jgi:DNA-binding response OmpR family regulator
MPDFEARMRLLEDENTTLRDRVEHLEEALGMAAEFPLHFGLTGQESICLGVLLKNKAPRKATFMTALYSDRIEDEVKEKIVDVFICKMRKKLAPHGVAIETMWGEGYFLKEETKTRLRELMAAA